MGSSALDRPWRDSVDFLLKMDDLDVHFDSLPHSSTFFPPAVKLFEDEDTGNHFALHPIQLAVCQESVAHLPICLLAHVTLIRVYYLTRLNPRNHSR